MLASLGRAEPAVLTLSAWAYDTLVIGAASNKDWAIIIGIPSARLLLVERWLKWESVYYTTLGGGALKRTIIFVNVTMAMFD